MIEQAKPEYKNEVMPLLLSAIGSIAYDLSGTEDKQETLVILSNFYTQENNRISYRQMLLDRRDGRVAGMLIAYAGDDAERLDNPIKQRLAETYGPAAADQVVMECRPGDYYLDSVAVDERYRGHGIASGLIQAFERQGGEAGCARLSLIVEEYNEKASRLYRKLGYKEDGVLLIGGNRYTRMIKLLAGQ